MMVPRRELESPHLSILVPETSASTNSATSAWAGVAAFATPEMYPIKGDPQGVKPVPAPDVLPVSVQIVRMRPLEAGRPKP